MSVCSEPEGSTGRKNNALFFALGDGYISPNGAQIRALKAALEQLSDRNTLQAVCSLYALTQGNFDLYVTADAIAAAAHLKVDETETALRDFPLIVKEETANVSIDWMARLLTFRRCYLSSTQYKSSNLFGFTMKR